MAEQIYGLIGKAMSKISAIGKDSAATDFKGKEMYKFRGIDAVYNALNPVMSELGLFIIPEVIDHKREERLSSNDKTLIYSIVTMRFTMYAPDGSSVSGTLIGEGMDSGDKATNKAMSIAMKYFCFQTFMIPTEDIKDPDFEVHEISSKRATPPAKPNVQQNDHQSAPANVTTAPTIPNENPVLNYLGNEKRYMAQKLGKDAKQTNLWFTRAVNALVDSGTIPPPPAYDQMDQMTMEQAKKLIEAIYLNFSKELSDGRAS